MPPDQSLPEFYLELPKLPLATLNSLSWRHLVETKALVIGKCWKTERALQVGISAGSLGVCRTATAADKITLVVACIEVFQTRDYARLIFVPGLGP